MISLEKCNAKYLNEETTGEKCPLVVMDVSFISQTRLFPAVMRLLPEGGTMITLVKPQFEVGRSGVGKGGIVRDPRRRHEALAAVVEAAEGQGFSCRGTMVSPITGADGNEEYLACFRFGGKEEDKP